MTKLPSLKAQLDVCSETALAFRRRRLADFAQNCSAQGLRPSIAEIKRAVGGRRVQIQASLGAEMEDAWNKLRTG
jgi:hypothetical protein